MITFILVILLLASQNVIATFTFEYDKYKMLCLVNRVRVSDSLSTLRYSEELHTAAQWHSNDQARRQLMTHTGSDHSTPSIRISRAHYKWDSVGENVAFGYKNEQKCMDEWMESPGHRANILGKTFTDFGSAMAKSPDGTPYYTQDFGGNEARHRYPVCPQPPKRKSSYRVRPVAEKKQRIVYKTRPHKKKYPKKEEKDIGDDDNDYDNDYNNDYNNDYEDDYEDDYGDDDDEVDEVRYRKPKKLQWRKRKLVKVHRKKKVVEDDNEDGEDE